MPSNKATWKQQTCVGCGGSGWKSRINNRICGMCHGKGWYLVPPENDDDDDQNVKVLIACEWSGRVRDAFRARGHDAFSCDIESSNSEFHLQCDVFDVIDDGWDMMIAFPPCTYLTRANPQAFMSNRQLNAARFVQELWHADIERIAIENPPGVLPRYIGESDQVIQPWWFGESWIKSTCLWLKNLPPLHSTNPCPSTAVPYVVYNRNSKLRGRTFQGIADAMAEQWGQGMGGVKKRKALAKLKRRQKAFDEITNMAHQNPGKVGNYHVMHRPGSMSK